MDTRWLINDAVVHVHRVSKQQRQGPLAGIFAFVSCALSFGTDRIRNAEALRVGFAPFLHSCAEDIQFVS